ncbi:MAG: D-alanyl-D-alanine carboxypeptidase/D-alanyl-D-alanine-endopeptidase [Acidimicrobiia bacterium]|nr:D-alanyl-D-alanine carboxypeptidase/D-alanyl-D-alanine-endopeptidase [Acidimicrobiia bacterium]
MVVALPPVAASRRRPGRTSWAWSRAQGVEQPARRRELWCPRAPAADPDRRGRAPAPDTGEALRVARRRADRYFTHRVGYLARVLGIPLVCLVIAVLAFRQAGATDTSVAERDRVEVASPATPLLSTRRLPATVAHPSRTVDAFNLAQPIVAEGPVGTSCTVVTTATGTPVYEHNPRLGVAPASNLKVVTAYATLARLGPDHRYRTQLVTDARVEAGIVEGDVWLVGAGDPVLATADYAASFISQPQLHTPVESLVAALQQAGVTHIRGALIGDASRYDDQHYVPSWPQRWRTGTGELPSGPLTALNLNDGLVSYPSAGQEHGGSGPREAAENPAQAATARVAELLGAAGVAVDGGVRVGKAPPTPIPLAFVDSPPMGELVRHMLTESDNTASELFLKELGAVEGVQGTTAGGTAVMAQVLAEGGFPLEGVAVTDGSGLDEGNLLTCRLLTMVLALVPQDSPLVAGLPVAGQTGTLLDRFAASPAIGRVRAKTGTLDGASGLAGYIDTNSGERIVFAALFSGSAPETLEPLEERLATALLTYPLGASLAQLGPLPAGG